MGTIKTFVPDLISKVKIGHIEFYVSFFYSRFISHFESMTGFDDDEVAAYYMFMSLMQASSVLLLTIMKDDTMKKVLSDQLLQLSVVVDGRAFSSKKIWTLPMRGDGGNEMRYLRVNWGERDTFQQDFRMKRDASNCDSSCSAADCFS